MLKKRVIPVLLFNNGRLVKGVQFDKYRETGLAHTAMRVYSSQYADEVYLLNISPTDLGNKKFTELLNIIANESNTPLCIGGQITSLKRVGELIKNGGDKVLVNSYIYDNPKIIQEITKEFGSQVLSVGIDFRKIEDSIHLFSHNGKRLQKVSLSEHIKKIQDLGAGEIFLNSIDKDGTKSGFDLEIIRYLPRNINIPLVIGGGAGDFSHLADALRTDIISAVACASLFHFGDNNPIRARSYLKNQGIQVRALK